MRRLTLIILSAGVLVASIVLWICSLNKICVVAHYGDADIRALNGQLYLEGPRSYQQKPNGVIRSFAGFGYLNGPNFLLLIVPIWVVALAAGVAYLFALIWRRHPVQGHCTHCGYNLAGNTSGICPECGTRIPAVSQ